MSNHTATVDTILDLISQADAWEAAVGNDYAPDTITDGWEWDDLVDPLDDGLDFSDYDPHTMRRW
jgi:hypothetical protein